MTPVRFLPAAFLDIRAAYAWYEGQRLGLGDEFAASLRSAVLSVVAFPTAHQVVHREMRRFLLERFPFALYFRADASGILVVACLHAARDPEARSLRLDEGDR